MNKYTEIIDRYLSGEMSLAEKADFEKQLASNSELKSEFLSQRQIIEGIERVALKSEIKQGFKRGSFKNKAGKWILGFVIVALAVSTVFVIKTSTNEQDHKKLYKTPHAMASSDKEEKLRYELTEENNSNWVEADKQLLSQFFKISGKRDTVIETKAGIILAIPASSFYKNTGEEVAENIELEIKEAMNPLDIMKAGLSTTSNGELLRTGGMFYLNARQNGENLKIQGKGIYTSIPTNQRDKDMMLFDGKRTSDGQINWVQPKRFENKLIPVDILSLDFYPRNFLDSLKTLGYPIKNKKMTDSIYYSFVCETQGAVADSVFSRAMNESIAQPLNVFQTYSLTGNYSATSILRGQKDTLASYSMGCEIAPSRIRAIWDKKFNNTLLATKEFEERLKAIFMTCNPELLSLYINNMHKKMYQVDSMASRLLNEDKIEGPKIFKEFYLRKDGGVSIGESHMKELRAYMEEKRSIYEKAAQKTFAELYKKETILDEQLAQKRNEHAIKDAARLNKLFYEELQTNLESAYGQLGKPYYRPSGRSAVSLTTFHYESLYNVIPAPYYYSVPIVTTGWKNVDAYAYESLAKRQTLDYADASGKKATIRYQPFTLKVKDSENFDRIVAYLIPDKLTTFQKIPFKEGAYKENLNELIQYSAIVFGFKGNEVYVNSISEAKPSEETISLSLMSQKDLSYYAYLNSGATNDLIGELNHEFFLHKETQRKKVKTKQKEIRRKLMPVVFPCYSPPPQPTQVAPASEVKSVSTEIVQ